MDTTDTSMVAMRMNTAADLYLGIDCGTQGTKALLLGGDGCVYGRGYARHAIVERASGAREQDPQ